MKTLIIAAVSAAALFAAPSAFAGMLPDGGVTAADVAGALQAKGYKASISKDSSGDPLISSASDGTNWKVVFYGCHKGPRCSSIQFTAGFDLTKGLAADRINEWNRKNRFGRGYLDDEQDPYVQMDVDVEHGFTSEAVANNVDTWLLVVSSFRKFVS